MRCEKCDAELHVTGFKRLDAEWVEEIFCCGSCGHNQPGGKAHNPTKDSK